MKLIVAKTTHFPQQAGPGSVGLDDSDTEEFDDLCDEIMEIVEEREGMK